MTDAHFHRPRTGRNIRHFALLCLTATANACTSTTETRTISVFSAVYRFGPCALTWSPSAPPSGRTVVDFYFGSDGSGPTSAEAQAIERGGGAVGHRFNVPIVRAVIDVKAVPALIGMPPAGAYYAATVTDPSTATVQVAVLLDHPPGDADIARAVALGGQNVRRYDSSNLFTVDVDDALIPRLRAVPGVTHVEFNGAFVCLD
jgi:hypothetical protein